MDQPRTDQARRHRKRWIVVVGVLLALVGITVAISRLKPAAPTVERNLVWVDTVKRGEMLREVRGIGTLVPEQISWIAARSAGRVDRILLHPGADVKPDDVILVLTNPEVAQVATDAASQLKAAQADLQSFKVQLESGLLAAESTAAAAKADFEQAKLRAQVNEELFKKGLVSELDMRLSKVTAEQAEARNTIEQKRFAFAREGVAPQLAMKVAEVDRVRTQAKLRQDELDALKVRAGMAGVLQVVPVEIGAQVAAGANLARVADPSRLKAEVRIAETQAKDVRLGLPASIDTRNGVVEGRVSRIDPAVQNGTVLVDVSLTGELPPGARPDLSIDGTIQLERLEHVVFVGRPAFGQEKSVVGMFKLDPNGLYAIRTPVRLGRSSVNTIEVVRGLKPGDRVILSDTSQWDGHDRIRLN
ncbi:MAG TPA: HlyD family efflux transporter periplasmic adaptor subunit [Steroidobacteraceae bacterium]|jgi:HlyD family secretion protein